MTTPTTVLLWFSAIGCGLMAGVYFAFSAFVMNALGRIDGASGASAMNSINSVILGSAFVPLFFGTTLAALALIILGIIQPNGPGALALIAGGLLYVVGMFVVTIVFNVPLNNSLAAIQPGTQSASEVWSRFLTDWTFWNHVRTLACTAASALFIFALIGR